MPSIMTQGADSDAARFCGPALTLMIRDKSYASRPVRLEKAVGYIGRGGVVA
jgi:hypothetical protein